MVIDKGDGRRSPDKASADASTVLEVFGVTKTYGNSTVLNDVSFTLKAGEILALVGANGAGKSTLTSILSGSLRPTGGAIKVCGRDVRFKSVSDASKAGIETICQSFDDALLFNSTVGENLVFPLLVQGRLGHFPRGSVVDAVSKGIAGDLRVPLDAKLGDLDTSDRQRVLIARALSTHPKILILDEPTASLDIDAVAELHRDLRTLARAGTAIIYISHHMHEISDLCDRAIVLRDGGVVGEFAIPLDLGEIIKAMLGKSASLLSNETPDSRTAGTTIERRPSVFGKTVLTLRDLRTFRDGAGISLDLHKGEILGIVGLIGAGKTTLLSQIIGEKKLISGRMKLDGRPFSPHHPADAIAAGIGYVPENRQLDGEIGQWTVEDNLVLPDLKRYRTKLGLVSSRRIRLRAASIMRKLGIVGSPASVISSLSGGNRQKVIIGRWFAAHSRLIVMDEPFRGVDIGARADIAEHLRDVGTAVVASSDPDEILQVADRIVVLSRGEIINEVNAHAITGSELSELIATGA